MPPSDAHSIDRLTGVAGTPPDPRIQHGRIEHLANYDALTGHLNRSRLREAVDLTLAAGERAPSPAAFLAVGIDDMSAINETVGSEAADTVLIEIGRRLDACVRVSDLIGRLGGDRFGVLLAHCPPDRIAVAAEKILEAVRSLPLSTERGPVAATVSIGSASCADPGLTSYDVITRAEAALAEAKRGGRDCYALYRTSDEQRQRKRRFLAIGDAVQAALRQDRVAFAFQPVVSATTGAVDYYECLLRLRDTEGEPIAAGEFVREIEQLGLIRLIDRYILDKAVAVAVENPGVTLGFNVSALTAADRPWLRSLTGHLRAHPGLAGRLLVEITETAALYDIEEAARFVAALRALGCRVALDDFGAGHTSLQHLQSLTVDTVKIDAAFVCGIAASAENQAFLRHLLGLARGFGFRTVAEGVEGEADAAALREAGVDFMQGHYFGRAVLDPPW